MRLSALEAFSMLSDTPARLIRTAHEHAMRVPGGSDHKISKAQWESRIYELQVLLAMLARRRT